MSNNVNNKPGIRPTAERDSSLYAITKLGVNCKRWIKTAMMMSGVLSLASRLARPGIVVLYYHSVKHEPAQFANYFVPGIIHSLSSFEEQMEHIARRYNPVSMDDVLHFLKGEMELPPRAVAVNFDDGFADNFELAAPVLTRLGIQGLFNVTVGSIESANAPWFCRLHYAFSTTRRKSWLNSAAHCVHPIAERADRRAAFLLASQRCAKSADAAQATVISTIERELDVEPLQSKNCPMMTWDQVRGLRHAGHIVGSHSLSHPNLAYVDDETQWKEISQSKIQLENQLGARVDHFSYPNPIMHPNFNERTIHCTQRAGYKLAATGISGPVRYGHDRFTIHRVAAPSNLEEFTWYLENTRLGRQL